MRNRTCTSFLAAVIVAVILIVNISCNTHFSGTLTDNSGAPLANAIVYVEAYTNGAYDFTWGITDKNGNITSDNFQKLSLPAKPFSKFCYCILPDGKVPFIVNDRQGLYKNGDISFIVSPDTIGSRYYNPALFSLAFPFENNSALRKKLQSQSDTRLIKRFAASYDTAHSHGGGGSPDALRKAAALDRLVE